MHRVKLLLITYRLGIDNKPNPRYYNHFSKSMILSPTHTTTG